MDTIEELKAEGVAQAKVRAYIEHRRDTAAPSLRVHWDLALRDRDCGDDASRELQITVLRQNLAAEEGA